MARGEIPGDIIGIDVATALSNAYSAYHCVRTRERG